MTNRTDEIGAHMSIAGGLHLALERCLQVGCGAVQIFLKNQRQWAAKPLGAEEIRMFRAARRRTEHPDLLGAERSGCSARPVAAPASATASPIRAISSTSRARTRP